MRQCSRMYLEKAIWTAMWRASTSRSWPSDLDLEVELDVAAGLASADSPVLSRKLT
jgi:hypothetical protein